MNLQWTEELEKQIKEFRLYEHYVYVAIAEVEGSVLAKIGHTGNVRKRMLNLCAASAIEVPLAVILGARSKRDGVMMEAMLHTLLRTYRTHGEWLRFTMGDAVHKAALNGAIKTVQTTYGTQRIRFDVAEYRKLGHELADKTFARVTSARLPKKDSLYKALKTPANCEVQAKEKGEAIAMELEIQRDRILGKLQLAQKAGKVTP